MKLKTILTAILFMTCLVSFGQKHRAVLNREITDTEQAIAKIIPHCTFELGWEQSRDEFWLPPQQQVIGSSVWNNDNSMYSMVDLSVQYKGLKLYNYTKTYFNKDKSIYFNPLQMEFNIGIVYGFKSLPLSIYYEHDCQHDIEARTHSTYYDRVGIHYKLF